MNKIYLDVDLIIIFTYIDHPENKFNQIFLNDIYQHLREKICCRGTTECSLIEHELVI